MAYGEGSASSPLPRSGLKRPHGQSPYGLHAAPPSRLKRPHGQSPYGLHAAPPSRLKRPHGQSPYGLHAAPPSRRLRQDFVDEQLGALALLRALLVMARDHLADQTE